MGDGFCSRSELESEVGKKRSNHLLGENLDPFRRVKMRDLDSVCRSEEMGESNRCFSSLNKGRFNEHLNVGTAFPNKTPPSVVEPGNISLDLNCGIRPPGDSAKMNRGSTSDKSKGFSWDLNADDKSNSPDADPFFPYKNREHLRAGDDSECGSTTGPLEDKDPMRVWNEMKQNGFLSSKHASIAVPKQRGKKSKSEKKMELAKKEQVDRFAKIAAPSGLLNELNPGIINHVRNRKQVHSIIENLVREKNKNQQGVGKQAVSSRTFGKDDHVSGLGMNQLGVSRDESMSDRAMTRCTGVSEWLRVDQSGRDGNISKVDRWFLDKSSVALPKRHDREDDVLALKLVPPTIKASENISSFTNEESSNLSSVSSLSVKGANVAFQWLELLHQDIKGRLAALRRSKNRVRSVISTELPLLMSREFSSQENDPRVAKDFASGCSHIENVDAHRVKWNGLFDKMDKALSEEEKQLEIWLHQVKGMQLQCEKGLHQFQSQRPGSSETDHRLDEVGQSERELAVMAAAASIYSTCNYLSSKEN